ncbi:MAG: FAD-linked oxidase C-terminal domain-containing protein [Verrucomicrobiia bacterium]
MKTSDPRWLRELRQALPAQALRTDADTLAAHSGDAWFARALPEAVALPKTPAQVAAILRIASRYRIPVTPRGAAKGYVGGAVPVRGGIAVSLLRMNRILDLSAADAVAVVQPGVNVGDLKNAAEAIGFSYPPDPASYRDNSIGGNLATNAGGPRCLKYGVTKHYALGLQVALADGTLLRCGGRTHKNKAGFDLVSLFVGSEGLLGIITEATLRLIPKPPQRAVIVAAFANAPRAAQAVARIFAAGFLPAALEIADPLTLRAARAFNPKVPPGEALLLLEIDGQKGAVASDLRDLLALLPTCRPVHLHHALGHAASAKLWDMRKDFSASLRATGLVKLNEDVAVPRGRLLDLFLLAEKLEKKYQLQVACFGHAGDGNIHVNLMVPPDQAQAPRTVRALDQLFATVLRWGGTITGEHGIGLAKKRWWDQAASPPLKQLHAQLKQTLDPLGLLNPGKFLED